MYLALWYACFAYAADTACFTCADTACFTADAVPHCWLSSVVVFVCEVKRESACFAVHCQGSELPLLLYRRFVLSEFAPKHGSIFA